MSEAKVATRPSWSRLWQIPFFLLSAGVFSLGLNNLYKARRPVPFAVHVKDLQKLMDLHRHEQVVSQINKLSGEFLQRAQQAQLHEFAGENFYLMQANFDPMDPAFAQRIIYHYATAVRLGMPQTAVMDLQWGRAALAMGQWNQAIEHLERACKLDPNRLPQYMRALAGAYLAGSRPQKDEAIALVKRALQIELLTPKDRVWALTQWLELALGRANIDSALDDARRTLPKLAGESSNLYAQLLVWIGRAEYQKGRLDASQKVLQEARSRFLVHSTDDGRAALLLGKISQARGQLDDAMGLYQEVINSHAGSPILAAARLGRAEILALKGQPNEQMIGDYSFVIAQHLQGKVNVLRRAEFLDSDSIRSSLLSQCDLYQRKDRLDAALKFLELLRQLKEPETAALIYREALTKERQAEKVITELAAMAPEPLEPRVERYQEALNLFGASAEDYLKHAKLAAMDEDKIAGASHWKAAMLMDRAGRTLRAIEVYRNFILQRPSDPHISEGLYNIGLLYQSVGNYDEALSIFGRILRENPKTPSAYLATVQMARCHIAKGAPTYPKAEAALLGILENNQELLPSAREFRLAVFTLGELYYRTGRWSEAILRLEEAVARYGGDEQVPRAVYWLADSYRHSAMDVAKALDSDPRIQHRGELELARRERLARASGLFGQVLVLLEAMPEIRAIPAGANPIGSHLQVEWDYLRYSYLFRADCAYDLGNYPEAIQLYDVTANRFGQSITAVEAYVQVANAHLAMGKQPQAAAASERAQWILKRIPDEAFNRGPLALSRQYYEQFLKMGRLQN